MPAWKRDGQAGWQRDHWPRTAGCRSTWPGSCRAAASPHPQLTSGASPAQANSPSAPFAIVLGAACGFLSTYLLSWRQSSMDVVQAFHWELPLIVYAIIRLISKNGMQHILKLLGSQLSCHTICMMTVDELRSLAHNWYHSAMGRPEKKERKSTFCRCNDEMYTESTGTPSTRTDGRAGGPCKVQREREQGCWDWQSHCPACRRRGGTTGVPSTAEATYVFPSFAGSPAPAQPGATDMSTQMFAPSLMVSHHDQMETRRRLKFLAKRPVAAGLV